MKNYFLKLSEENGESVRAIRRALRPQHKTQTKETFEKEWWNVVFYAPAIANGYNMDLKKAIAQKEAGNDQTIDTNVEFAP